MNKHLALRLAAITTLLGGTPALAALPLGTAISYQGHLKEDGVPVNGLANFVFSLWDAPGSGNPPLGGNQIAAPLNRNNVDVVNGLFTVTLDFGAGAFDDSARWLQIEVAHPTNSGLSTLSPRQALSPVPFALYATRAGDLAGPSPSLPIEGIWQLQSGIMLPNFDANLAVTGLELEPGGVGRIYFRDAATGGNDCVRILYLFYNNDTLLIDFVPEPLLKTHPERTNIFPTVVINGNFLGLADDAGNIALFSKVMALPAALTCGALQVVDLFTDIPAPHSFSGLVLFDGDLVYSSSNQIEVFDLGTDSIATPLAALNNRFVQATQEVATPPHFWHHCGCGGSPEIFRSNLTTVFDTVHTGTNLNRQMTIRAATFLPTTNRLWLHGREGLSTRFSFLIVDSNAEPDVLDAAIDFNREVRGLAFDGTHLWGFVTMATRSLVRIDPVTTRVIESYEVPDEDLATWVGVAFDNNHMYLLGNTSSIGGNTAALYRVTPP